MTFNTTLNVSSLSALGAMTAASSLNVSGVTTLQDANILGNMTFNTTLNVSSLSALGAMTVASTLNVSGNSTILGTLQIGATKPILNATSPTLLTDLCTVLANLGLITFNST
jgi:hypothetical protein